MMKLGLLGGTSLDRSAAALAVLLIIACLVALSACGGEQAGSTAE